MNRELVCPICNEPVLRRYYYYHINLHQGGKYYDEFDQAAAGATNLKEAAVAVEYVEYG